MVMPAGSNGEKALGIDGADQVAGTDIGPMEPARVRVAVILPSPAPPLMLEVAPANSGSAASGAIAAGAANFGKMPKLASARWPR